MFRFKSEKVTKNVRRIHGFSDEQMYLIEGCDKAALIDTGCGIGDLKEYVSSLTDKEVIVILTHGHTDHAMGSGQFDTVYMSHLDDAVLEEHRQREYRDAYLRIMPGFDALEETDYQEPAASENMADLTDGQTFDLGGITLRIIAFPGHTPGMMTVLIEEERLLLTGDACNPFTFLFMHEALSLQEYEENLAEYKEKTAGLFDRVLFSHGAVEEPAADILDNVQDVIARIHAGNADDLPMAFVDGTPGLQAMQMDETFRTADGKFGNIVYQPKNMLRCDNFRNMFGAGDTARDAGLQTPDDVVRYDDIVYGDDPVRQSLDVYRPQAAGGNSLPVIVSIHGGGWVYGDKTRYQFYCMDLAQRGYAVVNYSYRLSPETKFPAALEDTNAVFRWVLTNASVYGLDLNNLFVVGDSAGAQYASQYLTMLTNPAYAALFDIDVPASDELKIRAVGLNCGVYDMKVYAQGESEGWRRDFMGEGYDPELKQLDVLPYITGEFPPAFIVTSYYDFLHDLQAPMYVLLQSKGIPCELHEFGGEDHPEIAHVFHLDIRSETGRVCNDMECAFFRKYESH